jgi:hypothetical protein
MEGISMKRKISVIAAAILFLTMMAAASAFAADETFTGYLADNLCIGSGTAADDANMKTNPEDHTVMCALMKPCVNSGYAVMVKDGSGGFNVYKLDKKGNKMAVKYLKSLGEGDNIYVNVIGTRMGDTITVKEITKAM